MRHEVDQDQLDENGIIKDGGRVRVGLQMMDSLDPLQKALAAAAAARPSPKRTGYVFDSDDRHAAKMRAYDQSKLHLSNAYKGGISPGDYVTFGGRQMTVDCSDEGRPRLRSLSATDGDARKLEAYDEHERDLNNAWRSEPSGGMRSAVRARSTVSLADGAAKETSWSASRCLLRVSQWNTNGRSLAPSPTPRADRKRAMRHGEIACRTYRMRGRQTEAAIKST